MRIVLIAPNVSQNMGGEAIKAFQYFDYLLRQGYDAILCAHARSREGVAGHFPEDRVILIEDDKTSIFLWKSRVFRGLLNLHFQMLVQRTLRQRGHQDAIWHFVTPISPVEPKLFPKDVKAVIGPLNGNIYYPPAFADRMGRGQRLQLRFHRVVQRICRLTFGDKRRASVILNSGFDRTTRSLGWAGATAEKIFDAPDSGLAEYVIAATPVQHHGVNKRFVSMGRFADDKGFDLTIKALARCREDCTLTLYGGGDEENALRQLATDLGVAGRVNFAGWLDHKEIVSLMAGYRGFVFPTLAEANGIVIQEMMMIGLPIITLNWGGPAELISDQAGFLIDPDTEDHVIDGVANAMTTLARDPDLANRLAQNARAEAGDRFTWNAVGESWTQAYKR